ncbi:MAG: nuclear transport factor 2 family protein [Novosphingobium sp.]|nr:nuclear transport factor 2 family protein [Novosphingobium sp.]
MSADPHDLIRRFVEGLSRGDLPDDLFTNDLMVWTTPSGTEAPKAQYQGAVRLLQSLFPQGLRYTLDWAIAEGNRGAAEVRSHGVLASGEEFAARYAFMFGFCDSRIATLAEHTDPRPVEQKIMGPLMAAMAQAG